MDLTSTDTASLADFINEDRHGLGDIARGEWLRRFGKPFPYHPSYQHNAWPNVACPRCKTVTLDSAFWFCHKCEAQWSFETHNSKDTR